MNKTASKSLVVIGAIGAIQFLQPFSVDFYLSSTGGVAESLKVDASAVQLALSVLTLGFALGQILAGSISDAIGRRKPLFWAIGLYIVASLGVALASNIYMFASIRMVQGLAGSAVSVISIAILRDLFSGMSLIRASSNVSIVGAFAWIIGPALGSLMLNFTDWRGISLFIALAGLLIGTFAWRSLPETHHEDSRSEYALKGIGKRFVNVFKDRVFFGLAIMQMAIGTTMFGYLGISPMVFESQFGLGQQVGIFIAINSFGAYVGIQVGSRLAKIVQPQWLLVSGLALVAVTGAYLYLIGPNSPTVFAIEVGLFAWTFLFGATMTPIQGLALTSHGTEAGTAAAVLGVMNFLGPTLAGPYFTTLERQTSSGIGQNMFLLMLVAIASVMIFVRPWTLSKLK
ncbi:MAG: Bcr/CflA family efflux MFS transporter [Micrococcales bacterium]